LTRIGIVVGMASEAALALAPSLAQPEPFRPKIFVSGASAARAFEGARQLVIDGVEALLSFGLAGGLEGTLEVGDAILARAVLLADGTRVETDPGWRARLEEALRGRGKVSIGDVVGADAPVAGASEKMRLRLRSGAVAVDMESHGVAAAAREAGVPFMVLRAILDPARQSIPSAALAGIDAQGNARAARVIARLFLKPWELPGLIALGRAHDAALGSLGRLTADLGATFVFGP
jgi:hopanoid-associated phosphorylase